MNRKGLESDNFIVQRLRSEDIVAKKIQIVNNTVLTVSLDQRKPDMATRNYYHNQTFHL